MFLRISQQMNIFNYTYYILVEWQDFFNQMILSQKHFYLSYKVV